MGYIAFFSTALSLGKVARARASNIYKVIKLRYDYRMEVKDTREGASFYYTSVIKDIKSILRLM